MSNIDDPVDDLLAATGRVQICVSLLEETAR